MNTLQRLEGPIMLITYGLNKKHVTPCLRTKSKQQQWVLQLLHFFNLTNMIGPHIGWKGLCLLQWWLNKCASVCNRRSNDNFLSERMRGSTKGYCSALNSRSWNSRYSRRSASQPVTPNIMSHLARCAVFTILFKDWVSTTVLHCCTALLSVLP